MLPVINSVSRRIMRISGVKRYQVNGRTYAYHRRTRIRLYAAWGTPSFYEELSTVGATSRCETTARYRPETLYRACKEFQCTDPYRLYPLQVRTRFQDVLKWLPDRDATTPLTEVTRDFIWDLRNKATRRHGFRFGNMSLVLMQAVLAWSVANGTLKENPAISVPKARRPNSSAGRDRRRIAAVRAPVAPLSDSTKKEILGG